MYTREGILSDTWISLKNTGTEPVSLVFVFSAPGFEETMRCNSVPANEKPTPLWSSIVLPPIYNSSKWLTNSARSRTSFSSWRVS